MGYLLGFVVSKDGFQIDPLKIAAILALPAPTNLLELQSFQGKENFPTLHIDHIIENCAGSVIFSLIDGFSGYNQIEILPTD